MGCLIREEVLLSKIHQQCPTTRCFQTFKLGARDLKWIYWIVFIWAGGRLMELLESPAFGRKYSVGKSGAWPKIFRLKLEKVWKIFGLKLEKYWISLEL